MRTDILRRGIEVDDWLDPQAEKPILTADRIFITTPTHTHLPILERLAEILPRPIQILCEKPVVKSERGLDKILDLALNKKRFQLYMVNHYAYAYRDAQKSWGPVKEVDRGVSFYSYYNSGQDGVWDMIQPMYLAEGRFMWLDESTSWTCSINGYGITRDRLDTAYPQMCNDFIDGYFDRLWNIADIEKATRKVLEYNAKTRTNRNTSSNGLAATTGQN